MRSWVNHTLKVSLLIILSMLPWIFHLYDSNFPNHQETDWSQPGPATEKESLQGKRCFVPNSIVVDSLTFASALREIRGHPKWYTLVVLYGDAWKCRAILGIHSRCRSWMIMILSQHVCQHFSSGIHTMQQTSKLNQLQLRPQEKTTSSQGRCVFFFSGGTQWIQVSNANLVVWT